MTDGVVASPDTVSCTATLGGRRLRGTGPGGCTFALPRNANSKRLRVTVTATYGAEQRQFAPFVFRVR